MASTHLIFLVLNIFIFSSSAFFDSLTKCEMSDSECCQNLLQEIMGHLATNGLPDLNIPKLKNLKLNDTSMSLMNNMIAMDMKDGVVKGIQDAKVLKFDIDKAAEKAHVEMMCDTLTMKAFYEMSSPGLAGVSGISDGQPLTSNGKGKVVLEKLHLILDFVYNVYQKDGENYFKVSLDKYDYDLKDLKFFAPSIKVGGVDSTEFVLGIFNSSWRSYASSIRTAFMDPAMKMIGDCVSSVFEAAPASKFVTDDLSS